MNASRSNATSAATLAGNLQTAPANFMRGEAGYSGGYLVYSPDALLGDKVRTAFPGFGLPSEASMPDSIKDKVRHKNTNNQMKVLPAIMGRCGSFDLFDHQLSHAPFIRHRRSEFEAAECCRLTSARDDVQQAYEQAPHSFNFGHFAQGGVFPPEIIQAQ